MLNKFWHLFIILFIEGSSLMGVELMGTKLLMQKFHIISVYVEFLILSFSQKNKAIASSDLKVLTFSEGLLGQMMVANVFKNGKNNIIKRYHNILYSIVFLFSEVLANHALIY